MDPELERQRAELQARGQAEAEAGMAQQGFVLPGMPSAATERQARETARQQESVSRLEQLLAQEQQRSQAPRVVPVGPVAPGNLQYDQPAQQGPQMSGVLGPNAAIEVQRTRGSAGGWSPTSRQVVGEVPEVMQAVRQFGPSHEKAAASLANIGNIQEQQYRDVAGQMKALRETQARQMTESQAQMRGRQAEQENAYQRFLESADRASNFFVNPDRRVHSERAVAGIASFLGGLSGGPNQALAAIQEGIQNDLSAQVANQRNLGENVRNMGTAFEIARANGVDERTAAEIQLADSTRDAMNEVRRLGAMAQSQEAQNRANILIDELNNQYLTHLAQAANIGAGRTTTAERYRAPSGPGVRLGYRMLDAQGQPTGAFIPGSAARSQLGVDVRTAPLADIRLTPSQTGGAPELTSGEQQRLYQYGEARGAIDEGLNTVNRMLTLVRQHGAPGAGMAVGRLPEFLLSPEGQQYRRLAANVLRSEAFRTGGKTFTQAERKLVMDALGPLETGTPGQIETALGLLQQTYQNAARRIDQRVTPNVRAAYESGGMYGAAPETQTPGFTPDQGE